MTGEYHPMPTAACALFIEQNNAWVCQKVLRPIEITRMNSVPFREFYHFVNW